MPNWGTSRPCGCTFQPQIAPYSSRGRQSNSSKPEHTDVSNCKCGHMPASTDVTDCTTLPWKRCDLERTEEQCPLCRTAATPQHWHNARLSRNSNGFSVLRVCIHRRLTYVTQHGKGLQCLARVLRILLLSSGYH
jgi:hypothetical protein